MTFNYCTQFPRNSHHVHDLKTFENGPVFGPPCAARTASPLMITVRRHSYSCTTCYDYYV